MMMVIAMVDRRLIIYEDKRCLRKWYGPLYIIAMLIAKDYRIIMCVSEWYGHQYIIAVSIDKT